MNRLVKKDSECLDKHVLSKIEGLSMNGEFATFLAGYPLRLRRSKGERNFFSNLLTDGMRSH